jgi:hypothetical protein
MSAQLGQKVKVVDSQNVDAVLYVGHVAWVYKDGSFIVQNGANETRFTRNGILHGNSRYYNGQKILYAYLLS